MFYDTIYKNTKGMFNKMSTKNQCEMCAHYVYDDEYEENICNMNLDEDELVSFYQQRTSCPYFKFYDEYKMVQKQN